MIFLNTNCHTRSVMKPRPAAEGRHDRSGSLRYNFFTTVLTEQLRYVIEIPFHRGSAVSSCRLALAGMFDVDFVWSTSIRQRGRHRVRRHCMRIPSPGGTQPVRCSYLGNRESKVPASGHSKRARLPRWAARYHRSVNP